MSALALFVPTTYSYEIWVYMSPNLVYVSALAFIVPTTYSYEIWVFMSLNLVNMSALVFFVPTTYSHEILGLHKSYLGLHDCSGTYCPHFSIP